MQPRKTRWSKVYESSEEELLSLLESKNLAHTRQELQAGEVASLAPENHETRLWCAEGGMTLETQSKRFSVQVGDCVHIPANAHSKLNAGLAGCSWYQTS